MSTPALLPDLNARITLRMVSPGNPPRCARYAHTGVQVLSKAMDALYVRNFPKNDGLSLVPPGAKFLFVDCLSLQRCKRNLFADNVPERVQISRYAP
jgi:hypothetical protein